MPVVYGRDAQYDCPLLEDMTPHNGGTPFLGNVTAVLVRLTHDCCMVQLSLI